jgi:hypothetical protein
MKKTAREKKREKQTQQNEDFMILMYVTMHVVRLCKT